MDYSIVIEGLLNAFTINNLIWLSVGVLCGLFAGTLPGFSGGPMMAIMLPLVAGQPFETMIITLAGIYAAAVYSASTAGILYNIPGGAAGIPATLEGYKLRQQGRLKEAFAAQLGGSFYGALTSFILLLFLVPTFIYLVSFFGSAERALFAVWALVLISGGAVTKQDPVKSFLSVGIGLVLAMIGQQPNVGTFRFHMGLSELWGGLEVVWVILAVFAIPQLFNMIKLKDNMKETDGKSKVEKIPITQLYKLAFKVPIKKWRITLQSALMGVFIGIIPGIGTTTGAWVGYSTASSLSKEKDKFGKGSVDGVLGAESANNATEVGTIIPLLALGIPGGAAAAIMLAALIMAGITPGPSMYSDHGPAVWTIIFGIGFSGILFTLFAYPFLKGAQLMSSLPVPALVSGISALCILGAYVTGTHIFGAIVVVVLGILMVLGGLIGLKPAPLLIGFILGSGIEKELIRAYQIGGFKRFLETPSLIILTIIILTIAFSIYGHVTDKIKKVDGSAESVTDQVFTQRFIMDKLLVVLSIGLAIILLINTLEFPLLASIWVYFVAIFFVILPSILLLFKDLFSISRMKNWFNTRGHQKLITGFDPKMFMNQLVVTMAFILYILLINVIGFILSSMVFVLIVVFYLDRKLLKSIFYSAVIGFGIFLLKLGFGLYIPTSIWGI